MAQGNSHWQWHWQQSYSLDHFEQVKRSKKSYNLRFKSWKGLLALFAVAESLVVGLTASSRLPKAKKGRRRFASRSLLLTYFTTTLLCDYDCYTRPYYYYKDIRAYEPTTEDQCRCRAHHQLQGWRSRGCRGCKGRSLPDFSWSYKSMSRSFSNPCKL